MTRTLVYLIKKIKTFSYRIRAKYYCSVCGKSVLKFKPLSTGYEENAKKYGYKYFGQNEHLSINTYSCPYCGSADRDRLYALYFSQFSVDRLKAKKLLHVAPTKALNKYLEDKLLKVVTTDLLMKNVDLQMDIENMHLIEDNEFNYFICSHVLEHVNNPDKALEELYRVLNTNGMGIIMAPIIPSLKDTLEDDKHVTEIDRIKNYGQADHLRLFSKRDFCERIKSAKFELLELDESYFGKKTYRKLGLRPSSVLYVGKKK